MTDSQQHLLETCEPPSGKPNCQISDPPSEAIAKAESEEPIDRSVARTPGNRIPAAIQQESFPLMRLPPELRCMIYREVLVAKRDIIVPRPYWSYIRDHNIRFYRVYDNYDPYHSSSATCQIFRVSKALYNEAMPVYFGENTFHFEDLDALETALGILTAERRRSIRSLSISFHGSHPVKSTRLLYGCVSLRRLSLVIKNWGTYHDLSGITPWWQTICGAKALLKVRGIQTLRVRKAQLNSSAFGWCSSRGGWEKLVSALQVLKQPYSEAALRRQYRKDYPPAKAKRTVFGRANVVTRSESKLASNIEVKP
ncbi:MAG: hypothetical protein Q9171_002805 [Xanthocarpia ochracea]